MFRTTRLAPSWLVGEQSAQIFLGLDALAAADLSRGGGQRRLRVRGNHCELKGRFLEYLPRARLRLILITAGPEALHDVARPSRERECL